MPNITIYSTQICPYCDMAKGLLKAKNANYNEIKVDSEEVKNEMIKKSGGAMTVPQIFIDDYHVGGFDDLEQLNREGKLDDLLK